MVKDRMIEVRCAHCGSVMEVWNWEENDVYYCSQECMDAD